MALKDLLTTENKKMLSNEITEELIIKDIDKYRQLVSYWRVYPDRLIDYYCSLNPKSTFHFFFYQRLFLRCVFRYRYIYATFVRA